MKDPLKIRLNKDSRDAIERYMNDVVNKTDLLPEEKLEREKLNKEINDEVISIVTSKFPPEDMKILAKYKLTDEHRNIDLIHVDTRDYSDHTLLDDKRLVMAYCRGYSNRIQISRELYEKINSFRAFSKRLQETKYKLHRQNEVFVNNAKTVGDVVSCVDLPADIYSRITSSYSTHAVTVMNPELVESIKSRYKEVK